MLLAAAEHLAQTRDFAGTVTVIFPGPPREGLGGDVMVDEGLFDRFPCDEIYAPSTTCRCCPSVRRRCEAARPLCLVRSFQRDDDRPRRPRGHAAMPHKTIDPGMVMAHTAIAP